MGVILTLSFKVPSMRAAVFRYPQPANDEPWLGYLFWLASRTDIMVHKLWRRCFPENLDG